MGKYQRWCVKTFLGWFGYSIEVFEMAVKDDEILINVTDNNLAVLVAHKEVKNGKIN